MQCLSNMRPKHTNGPTILRYVFEFNIKSCIVKALPSRRTVAHAVLPYSLFYDFFISFERASAQKRSENYQKHGIRPNFSLRWKFANWKFAIHQRALKCQTVESASAPYCWHISSVFFPLVLLAKSNKFRISSSGPKIILWRWYSLIIIYLHLNLLHIHLNCFIPNSMYFS